MDHTDVLADLPAPFDGEPESVRKDIADELADHLACAYRRELLLTVDEQAARQNVFNKFGDPRRIARQLWFQALWGRIMLAKLKLAVPWLKSAAVVLVLYYGFTMYGLLLQQVATLQAHSIALASQTQLQRKLLEQVLQRLPQPAMSIGPAVGYSDPGSPMGAGGTATGLEDALELIDAADDAVPLGGFLLRLVDDRDPSKPVDGCVVALAREDGSRVPQRPSLFRLDPILMGGSDLAPPGMGAMASGAMIPKHFGPMKQYAYVGEPVVTADLGRVRFPKVEPGRYRLFIEFPDGLMCDHRIVISPDATDEDRQLTVKCPTVSAIPKAYVLFEMPPLPKVLQEAGGIRCEVHLGPVPQTGRGIDWQNSRDSRYLTLLFDPGTGVVNGYRPFKTSFAAPGIGNSNPFLGGGAESESEVYLGDLKREDRFIAVSPGRYQATLTFHRPGSLPQSVRFEEFPATGDAVEGIVTITSETKAVKFDGPAGWQETLVEKLGNKPSNAN